MIHILVSILKNMFKFQLLNTAKKLQPYAPARFKCRLCLTTFGLCLEVYGLDPARFFFSTGSTRKAILRQTKSSSFN